MKELESERLVLRKVKLEDANEMFNGWCTDIDVCKYLPWNVHPNIEFTKKLLKMWIDEYNDPTTYRWMVVLKENNEPIGTIDVVKKDIINKVYEVGYCYKKNAWGHGYGSEALARVISFLFDDVGAELVCAKHYENNIGSYRVMEKCGMIVDGTLRSRIIYDGHRISLICHSITKEEYLLKYKNMIQ